MGKECIVQFKKILLLGEAVVATTSPLEIGTSTFLTTQRQTDGQMDGRTDRQTDNQITIHERLRLPYERWTSCMF